MSYVIYDFGLYEAYRGQGIGQQALAVLEEEAKQLGVKKLSLHVFAHNKKAKRLYEKMNFETTDLHMSKRNAMEKVKAGTWTVAEAMEKAEEQFAALLPNGIETINHYLWSIMNDSGNAAGWVWIYADPHHPQKEAINKLSEPKSEWLSKAS
ncbi:GNAT family N-acetyltransferase [Bacillus licheniformis]|nr:GNAT family N-acetyltransferase [Bacillus licheniformis]